ncbi:LPXTG-motif cell wall-anchored protein [Paraburkholderia sp. CI2]|nr:LPXTG-motif cell wall-anchored protein [Paraburkholderia sp. CI2]
MNFIERWFGVSPDGGDGTLELIYLILGVLLLAVLFSYIAFRRRKHLEGDPVGRSTQLGNRGKRR